MSDSIERRVVEMRFDNDKFEDGVKTTLKSLDELTKGLNKAESADGLEELAKVSEKNFTSIGDSMKNMTGVLTDQTRAIKLQYSALYRAFVRFKDNMVHQAESFIKGFTVEPRTQGFQEYELKMQSIQTIMASTGEPLDRVKDKLEELNKYADETIYSFSDMTTNIGKFTNAGVKLDDAVAAIKGVSSWAAVSGAGAAEASRAMYNLAQSLSAGYVKLIDWKSIENANMVTVEFKNQLLEAAVASNKLKKQQDGTYKTLKGHTISATKNFNEYLSDQWLTSEALIATLKEYADDTTEIGKKAMEAATKVRTFSKMMDTLKEASGSGWAMTFEHIWGDYDKATEFFTGLTDKISGVLESIAEVRNGMLEAWEKFGGQKLLHEAIFNIIDIFTSIGGTISSAFQDVFNIDFSNWVDLGAKLYIMTQKVSTGIKNFLKSLSVKNAITGNSTLDAIRNVLSTIFTLFKVVGNVAVSAFKAIFSVVGPVLDMIIQGLGSFSGWLNDLLAPLTGFKKHTKNAFSPMTDMKNRLDSFVSSVSGFGTVIEPINKTVSELPQKFKDWFNTIKEEPRVKKLSEDVRGLWDTVKNYDLFGKVSTAFTGWINKIKEIPEVKTAIANITEWWNDLKAKLTSQEFAGSAADGLSSLIERLGSLKQVLSDAKNWIDEKFTAGLTGIASFINGTFFSAEGGESGASFSFSEFIQNMGFTFDFTPIFEWAKTARDAILNALSSLFISSASADELPDGTEGSVFNSADAVIENVESGITEKVNALQVLWDKIKEVFGSIQNTLSDNLSYEKFKDFATKVSEIIQIISPAISGIVGIFVKIRSGKGLSALTTGLGTFGKSLGEAATALKDGNVSLFQALTGGTKDISKSISDYFTNLTAASNKSPKESFGTTLLKVAGGIALLAGSLWLLSKIDEHDINKGLTTIGILAAGLLSVSMILGKSEMRGVGSTFLQLAGGMLLMILPMKILAGMDPSEFTEGLLKMATILFTVGLLMQGFRSTANTKIQAGPIIGLAVGLTLLTIPLKTLANMDSKKLIQGIIGMGAVMAEIAILMQFMRTSSMKSNTISRNNGFSAAPIIAMAAGMALMLIPLKIIANMKPAELVQGLVGLGLLMVEVGIAVNAFRKIGNAKINAAPMVALAFSMVLMMIPLEIIGHMKPATIVKGLTGLGTLMFQMGIMAKMAKGFSFSGGAGLVMMGLAMNLLIPPIITLSLMSWNGIAKAAVGIGSIALIVGAMSKLSTLKFNPMTMLLNIGSIAGVIAVVIGVLGALKKADDAFLGGAGQQFIGDTFEMLGVWIGKIISGIGTGASGTLKTIGEDMSSFATAISTIDSSSLGAADTMVEIMMKLGETELMMNLGRAINWLPVLFGKGASLSQTLVDFATGMAGYSSALTQGEFNADMVEKSEHAAGILMAIADKAPKEGGLLSVLIGDTKWAKLRLALPLFAHTMVAYANALEEASFNPSTIIDSKAAALLLMSLYSDAPKEGGWLDKVLGTANWESITTNLPKFATAMVTYAKELTSAEGLDAPGIIERSGTAAQLLLKLYSDMPKEGGWLDKVLGTANFDGLEGNLTKFAAAMVAYANVLTRARFKTDVVTKSEKAAQMLISLNKSLPNSNGLVQAIAGEKDWNSVSTGLKEFAEAMAAYSKAAVEIDSDGMSVGNAAADELIALANKIPEYGGIISWFTGENQTFDEFASGISNFTTALSTFSHDAGLLDLSSIKTVATFLDLLFVTTDAATNLSAGTGWGLSWAATNLLTLASDFADLADQMAYLVSSSGADFTKIGEPIGKGVNEGVVKGVEAAKLGSYISAGLAVGMRMSSFVAVEGARYLAESIKNKVREILKIKSPSREFIEIGKFCDEGLAKGLQTYANMPESEAKDMSKTILGTADGVIAELTNNLAQKVDPTLTLRPVLDMSEVDSGVGLMNRMFGNQGLTVGASTNFAQTVSAREATNGGGFANAINAINARVGELSDNIANMNVVLDSGALVGGISTKMDSSLGRTCRLKARGI